MPSATKNGSNSTTAEASTIDLSSWEHQWRDQLQLPYSARCSVQATTSSSPETPLLSRKSTRASPSSVISPEAWATAATTSSSRTAAATRRTRVTYFDGGKWPGKADGGGSSLELLDPDADNSTATAWAAERRVRAQRSWNSFTYEDVAVSDGIGNNAYHEFLIALLDSGEFLLDDVSVIENGSTEMIQNGDFEGDSLGSTAPTSGAPSGPTGRTAGPSSSTDPDSPGNQCLHIVATGPTGDKHNKLETTFDNSERVTAGAIYRISFRAKFLSGSNQVNTRLYFNYLQRTTTMPASEIWGTPGSAQFHRAWKHRARRWKALAHAPVVPDANQAVNVAIDAVRSRTAST